MERERELLEIVERQQYTDDKGENLEDPSPDESDSSIEISSYYNPIPSEIVDT